MRSNRIIRYLYITIGSISLAFGVLGIILPIIPTTPFLLLSSYCFVRSSKKLYSWLIHHKIFGSYLYHYVTYKAISKRAKTIAIAMIWISLSYCIYIVSIWYLKLMLFAIGSFVSMYILTRKTLSTSLIQKTKPETT